MSQSEQELINPDVSVEIYAPVIERITSAVSRSDVETGGKLLGRIVAKGNSIVVRVETFIDSGPRADCSASHLYPDGDYQEALFRIAEAFDPDIEHIGSWHTHHCNGLPELSRGDIAGYLKIVNNPNYNLDYFLAFLITDIASDGIRSRYYIFRRGVASGCEIDPAKVRSVQEQYPLEGLLTLAESVTQAFRPAGSFEATTANRVETADAVSPGGFVSPQGSSDFMSRVRADDRQWLLQHFPSAQAFRNREDGSVYWQWIVCIGREKLDVQYRYPAATNPPAAIARVLVSRDAVPVLARDIPLDDSRFRKIEESLAVALSEIDNVPSDNSDFRGRG